MEVPQNENSSTLHRITIRRMYDYGQKHGFEAAFKDIRNSIIRSKMPMWIWKGSKREPVAIMKGFGISWFCGR